MKFNEKLKKIRISSQIPFDELSSILNVSIDEILSWEEGTKEPSFAMIKTLSNIFNVSINEFIDSEDGVSIDYERKSKFEKRLFWFNGGGMVFSILSAPFFLKMMNDIVPIQYNIQGDITKYGSKFLGLGFVLLYIVLFLFSSFAHFRGNRRNEEDLLSLIYIQITLALSGLAATGLNFWFSLTNAKSLEKYLNPFLVGIFMAFLIVLSFFSGPKFNKKRNKIFGFRTRFTLSNQEAWEKVNHFQSISGIIFSIIGFIITLFTFENWNIYLLLLLLIVSIVPSTIYHERLRRELK